MRQNQVMGSIIIEKIAPKCSQNHKIAVRKSLFCRKMRLWADSSIKKHVLVPESIIKTLYYPQFLLVIKKKLYIIFQNLPQFGAKSLQNQWFSAVGGLALVERRGVFYRPRRRRQLNRNWFLWANSSSRRFLNVFVAHFLVFARARSCSTRPV